MSKVKIQGNASGTGVITLTAPNTNTDRTITLPDGDISLGVGIDDNATSTAITIDSSENVLIGMTAVSGTTDGLHLRSGIASGVNVTNDHCFALNRKSSDGEALRFLKDGALVGSIDVSASGASIKLGGTAAANALDDYEEGTWTPTFGGATISAGNTVGYYTKIGRQVFFQWYSSASTISSASGGAEILGLPFTTSSSSDAYGLFTYQHGTALDGGCRGGFINRANTNMHFIDTNGTAKASYVNGTQYIMISGTYFTA